MFAKVSPFVRYVQLRIVVSKYRIEIRNCELETSGYRHLVISAAHIAKTRCWCWVIRRHGGCIGSLSCRRQLVKIRQHRRRHSVTANPPSPFLGPAHLAPQSPAPARLSAQVTADAVAYTYDYDTITRLGGAIGTMPCAGQGSAPSQK